MPAAVLFLFLSLVRGVVSDPSGRPVQAATVTCGTETTSTDSSGAFQLANACEATVTKTGFATRKLTLGDTNAITLDLAPSSDQVLVTATGSPIAIEEAGVAATIFTAQDFEAPHLPFIEDLLRDVPGLNIVQTGVSGGLTNLFARGGDSDATLVLLDGVPITEPGGSIDLSNLTGAGIERMEVIRGPESALFGAEASSAVIQLFTKEGDAESQTPHGSLTYERGSFSTDHETGTLNGGLFKKFDYALTMDQFRSTGEFPNSAHRLTSGTGNLGFRLSDHTQFRATFREFDSYTGDPGQTAYGLIDYLANERVRDSTIGVRLNDQRGSRFVQHFQFGYHRYRDIFMDTSTQTDNVAAILRTAPSGSGTNAPGNTYLVALANPNNPTIPAAAPPGTFFVDSPQTFYPSSSLELTARADAEYQGTLTHTRGALTCGYEFERQAGNISDVDAVRYDNGVFVNDQYSPASWIFLNGGARLQQSSTFGTEFTPRGAVTFRLPTNTYFRVSGGRGIKEPELIDNFANTTFYVGNPNLKPEITDSFEAGLFREWFSRRLRTEVSWFRNSFTDLIEFDSAVNPGTWINIDKAWARGAEFSSSARLGKFVSVRGGYTLLDTDVVNDQDPTQIGLPLVRRPKNSGSVAVELTPRRFSFAAGARFVGERQEQDFVFYSITRNPGYTFVYVDGSFTVAKHLTPFFRVNNLTNADYQEVLGYQALSRNGTVGLRINW